MPTDRRALPVRRRVALAGLVLAVAPLAGATATSLAGAARAPRPRPAVEPAAAVSGPWVLRFDNEFNRGRLDRRAWSKGWYGSGITPPANPAEEDCYDPHNVRVTGGSLVITVTRHRATCAGRTRPYLSGLVTSNGKFSFTYGFVEARIRLSGASTISDWPAFWAVGDDWPQDGELDVVEGLGGGACFHFHSDAGGPGGCAGGTFARGWHTYGALWEPGRVTYYYDDREVGTISTGITSAPMHLVIDLAVSRRFGGPTRVPAAMRVDFVRVWQH